MKNLTLLISLLVFCCYHGQNVNKAKKQIYLAKYELYKNNKEKALEYYQKAFELNKKSYANDYLDAAALAFDLKKNEVAEQMLEDAIIYQQAPYDFIDTYKKLQPYRTSFQKVLENYDAYEKQYFQQLKYPQVYQEIQVMTERDQIVRQIYELYNKEGLRPIEINIGLDDACREKDTVKIRYFENAKKEYKELHFDKIENELMKKVDSMNVLRLIELTKKYGWEPSSRSILWHQRDIYGGDNYVWNFFKPYLENEIKEDRLEKDFFEIFENESNRKENLPEKLNINSSIKIDKRQKEVGRPPLYYDYLISGTKLPEGYEYDEKNLEEDLKNL